LRQCIKAVQAINACQDLIPLPLQKRLFSSKKRLKRLKSPF
jgi:hypothetical protein